MIEELNEDEPMAKKRFGFVPISVMHFSKTRVLQRAVDDEMAKGSYADGARLSSFNNQLANFILKMWGFKGCLVLDPFAGRARALLARNLGMHYEGYEVSPKAYADLKRRIDYTPLQEFENKPVIHLASSESISDENKYDLVFTCPPYWDVEDYDKLYEENVEGQLSSLHSYDYFMVMYKNIMRKCYDALKPGGFCIYVVSDIRRDKKLIPFAADTIKMMQEVGFIMHDIAIHKLNTLGVLGVSNCLKNKYVVKSHEYIIVGKKGFEEK